jgi:DNA-binding IclR family transcriptional regulator
MAARDTVAIPGAAASRARAGRPVERGAGAVGAGRRANGEDEVGAVGTTIQSVVVAARVLEALAASSVPIRLTELARQLGEAKARVHRHLTTLRQLGFVDQDRASERYRLGWKLVNLGQAAAEQFEIRKLAEPYMLRLRELSRQTVVLSVPANGEAMVAAVMESPNLVTISVRQGARLPAHASAQGRIVLAFAPEALQRRILGRKLERHSPRTIVDPRKLRTRLERIRRQLYEIAPGDTLLGITTLAAPLFNNDDELVGVVAIVGSDQFIPDPPDREQVALVRACAAAISARLNASAYGRLGIAVPRAFQLR